MAAALHDGVGSQLVHLISLSEQHPDPAMRLALEQCLLDLRLIVDSMDAQDESLAVLLARFRHRLQPVLERQGMSLHWDIWDPEALGAAGCLPRGSMAREIIRPNSGISAQATWSSWPKARMTACGFSSCTYSMPAERKPPVPAVGS